MANFELFAQLLLQFEITLDDVLYFLQEPFQTLTVEHLKRAMQCINAQVVQQRKDELYNAITMLMIQITNKPSLLLSCCSI